MEIQHTHPVYRSEDERAERLRELRRTCALLVHRQRQAAVRRERSA